MMRPMKLAGDQLMFGEGCLDHLKTIDCTRVTIVIGGRSMKRTGILDRVVNIFSEKKIEVDIFEGVEPDPSFKTVKEGAKAMLNFKPDLILALGGGSAMDAAKAMWVYYEHPELKTLDDLLTATPFPKLREKALFACIPSTAGTASEVSRSVVISEDGIKHGLGNMEMMPDIVICDPIVTMSMPPHITAETGMDAMTHSLEALVSNRANYVSDIFVRQAIKDIYEYLPRAYDNGDDAKAREMMLNASMIAGMAFTNVSLGIVHSIAHTIGSYTHVAHGLADAIVLPYVIEFNSRNLEAKKRYDSVAKVLGYDELAKAIRDLNKRLGIPKKISEAIGSQTEYLSIIDKMAEMAICDGCTKTNPVIPNHTEMVELMKKVY